MTDGKNQTSSYTYDALDRLTRITFQDGSQLNYVTQRKSATRGPCLLGGVSDADTEFRFDPKVRRPLVALLLQETVASRTR